MDIQLGIELVQVNDRAVVHGDLLGGAGVVFRGDLLGRGNIVNGIGGSHVLADIIIAFGRSGHIVECYTGRYNVNEGEALVLDRSFDNRDELFFVSGETVGYKAGT